MKVEITGSIVVYNTPHELLKKAVNSFLNTELRVKLYIIDNSPQARCDDILQDERIEYIFNNANLGYGKGHNVALNKAIETKSVFHLVMNPDIEYESNVLESLQRYMKEHNDVGLLMPQILYKDNEVQRLCKLLPSPMDLMARRFFSYTKWGRKRNALYELSHFNYNKIINTPCLSGCFMFIRIEALQNVGLFDSRYFMYLEDYDLVRRINQKYKTLFFPGVVAYHGYAKESYRKGKLLYAHIVSAIKYFNKWGWFFDRERIKLNKEILEQINLHEQEK